ncbi:DEAD-box ATP-dependent RNA helicase CshA [Eubacteriaceae bacterium CHKCI005]|uniref:ATP-dependent RNA helicase CshA n=1 Tax=Solibaculum mannosilyticum TaxID=2780922 RepID=A0A7I8D4L4_9FIRM|nr:DEAD/DEAH box helicase [Solibaculum mannosilyticum]BCI59574.1 RNA helicase [Solibaculum mannosilyticum]CZT55354.1 DEAD-box ATP-dependent RNA helicase CshA [Eubacteriaceae bacterium CHKCI005]
MQKMLFSDMPISDAIKQAVAELGFEEATSIQTASIPLILSGRDIIGQSQTGTGKTAAFSIPAIEKINPKDRRTVQVLILCPTRELAVQACDEINKFAKYVEGVRVVPVYGGQPIDRQFRALRMGAQIVVGTPGRVMDHMRRGTLKLDQLRMIILDEADEMLSMGFREDIETILQDVPEERQTLLFSATMSPEILQLTRKYQTDPELIKVTREQLTVPSIEQYYYEVPSSKKVEVLCRLLDVYNPRLSMVFCNTKRQVDELVSQLQLRGYLADGLHGDMKQPARDHVMDMFRAGNIDVLVATDVAARGIDVDDIGAVFNYDIPQDEEYYVHRIGRTGRAGKEGRAFTFVTGRREVYALRGIMRYTNCKIQLKAVPSSSQVREKRVGKFMDKVRGVIQEGNLEEYLQIVDDMSGEDLTSADIAAALVKMALVKEGRRGLPSREDDALFAAHARSQNRGSMDGRRRNRDRDQGSGRMSGRPRGERGGDRERVPMARLSISIGRQNKVNAGHILGAIAGETGLPGKTFGRIEIQDRQTIVEVPVQHRHEVLEAMKGCRILGKQVVTEEASGNFHRRPQK